MATAQLSRGRDPARRKWNEHKSGVTPQLRTLIHEAGGQTAFARKVWGDSAGAHKGKVAKWYYGRSGISADAAARVAAAFTRPLEWLLTGTGPDRPGATRPEAALEHELANAVTVRALGGANVEPWMRETLAGMIGGADLLGALVRLVREECDSTAGTLDTRRRIGRAIASLPAKGADEAHRELQRAYASAQPSSGRVFLWQPVTFARIAAPPAKRKPSKSVRTLSAPARQRPARRASAR